MKIDQDLRLVLSGGAGFDLSDGFDCNVFMIAAGDDWLVFDAGAGLYPDEFTAALANEGIDPARVKHLFLTHGHADHSGGAAAMRERHGVRVHAGAETAGLVSSGDEKAISLDRARTAGIYPPDYVYRPCPVDVEMELGRAMAFGPVSVTAIATPGHSFDHVSFLVETPARRILVAGDALFCEGKVAIQDIYDCHIGQVCSSVRTLAALEFDTLLPGHLNFSLRNAHRHAEAAMTYVERFACPPSIIC